MIGGKRAAVGWEKVGTEGFGVRQSGFGPASKKKMRIPPLLRKAARNDNAVSVWGRGVIW